MKKLPIVLMIMVLLYTGTALPTDIEGSWARDAINLAEQNIFAGIYDGILNRTTMSPEKRLLNLPPEVLIHYN